MVALGHVDALALVNIYRAVAPYGYQVAALQSGRPTLVDMLDTLYGQNPARPIHLIGFHQAGIGATRSWLKRVAGHWLRSNPDAMVYVGTQLVQECSAQAIALAKRAKVRPVTGGEAGLTNPTWEDPPPHEAHVLICQGPRCLARGARQVADHLYEHLDRVGIAQDCLITLTGCLYPCNRAPVVCIQPYQEWVCANPTNLPQAATQIKTLISNQIQQKYQQERSVS